MSNTPKEPSKLEFYLATLGAALTILLFGAIVAVSYYINKEGPAQEDIVAKRHATLAEVNAKQQKLISSYAWVDKEENIVQIPVDVAMELTVNDLRK